MASRRRRGYRSHEQPAGWLWMLFGLSLGLLVALGVYLSDTAPRRDTPGTLERGNAGAARSAPTSASARPEADAPASASPARADAEDADARRSSAAAAPRAGGPGADSSATRFEFYDLLPRYEVVVPEVEAPRAAPSRSVVEPGSYVLQAGSFTSRADADRRQASLALLGVESRVQRVTIDDQVFHRVRIGPISDLAELNRIRRQLADARVETLLMKVP